MEGEEVRLDVWRGPVADDEPHANFRRDVALRSPIDPLPSLTRLADSVGVPLGAVCRYALVRWLSAGSEALLELGPRWVRRLEEPVTRAEQVGSDAARLAAYQELRALLGWLAAGLDDPPCL